MQLSPKLLRVKTLFFEHLHNEYFEFILTHDPTAIQKKNGKWEIDNDLCWGCTICKQLFPNNIRIRK